MNAAFEIQLIAIIVSVACALPGTFLVLRKMAMMSDAITHTVLLGIVLAFFITHDLNSPLLIAGAALIGIITVWLTETVTRTKLVSEDSAIGIVFPLLFSIAIILITRYAGSVHLDTDSVLLGELAFAPFDRMIIFSKDIGAKSIYTMGTLLLINAFLLFTFYKELKLTTFDSLLAAMLGFSPVWIHFGLMALVSLTAVGAFEAVGSVLVIAFMIGPPLSAYLLSNNLKTLLFLSAGFGTMSAISGYQLSALLDVSIAGSMAVTTGLIFAAVFTFSPKQGLIGILLRKKRQREEVFQHTVLTYIQNHENNPASTEKMSLPSIALHLHWTQKNLLTIVTHLQKNGQITLGEGNLSMTQKGRDVHQQFTNLLFNPLRKP